jgi:hypothetical protein
MLGTKNKLAKNKILVFFKDLNVYVKKNKLKYDK